MIIKLITDDGEIFETMYVPDNEISTHKVSIKISEVLPTYVSKEAYIEASLNFGRTIDQHLRG